MYATVHGCTIKLNHKKSYGKQPRLKSSQSGFEKPSMFINRVYGYLDMAAGEQIPGGCDSREMQVLLNMPLQQTIQNTCKGFEHKPVTMCIPRTPGKVNWLQGKTQLDCTLVLHSRLYTTRLQNYIGRNTIDNSNVTQ